MSGLLLVVLAGAFSLGLHGVAGAATLPGCQDTYPDNCGSTPTTQPVDIGSAKTVTRAVDEGDTLPFTGDDILHLVVAGGALLFVGWGIVYVTRRPQP